MVGSSVLVRSRLSMSVQPPIANFPDNPEVYSPGMKKPILAHG